MLTRRRALLGTAAAGAALALPQQSHADAERSEASGTQPATGAFLQGAGYYRFHVGDAELTLISDGTFPMEKPYPTIGANASEQAVRDELKRQFIPFDHLQAHVNCLLINTANELTLVDAGCGSAFGPGTGKLRPHLNRLGADLGDISTLIVTHLHPDHIGGLLGPDGIDWLPKAKVIMHQAEAEFWGADNPDLSKAGVPEERKNGIAQAAKSALEVIGDRLEILDRQKTKMSPEFTIVQLPGHTPGHLGLHLGGDDADEAKVVYITDLIHVAPLQFGHPGWHVAFDTDPQQAASVRTEALEEIAERRAPIAGAHLPFPGLGHVRKAGEGFEWVPVVWQWDPEASEPYQAS